MRKAEININEAVKLIGNCKASRLPIVLEVLEQSGYRFSDDTIRAAFEEANTEKKERKPWGDRTEYLRGHRGDLSKEHWLDTDNRAALALREAYLEGLRFSRIAEYAGISRTQPYVYMYGGVAPDSERTERLLEAIERVRNELKSK